MGPWGRDKPEALLDAGAVTAHGGTRDATVQTDSIRFSIRIREDRVDAWNRAEQSCPNLEPGTVGGGCSRNGNE